MSELFAAFGLDWRLLLIQAFNFAILLGVLWKFAYTPILTMIDERRAKTAEGVKNAEEAARKLAAADGEGKTIVADAGREAEKLVAAARARADEKGGILMKEAEERAERIIADATARAEEERRLALQSSEREIAKAAMLAAEKILKQKTV
jgi:F-type H+-transporting ATPase subunit b